MQVVWMPRDMHGCDCDTCSDRRSHGSRSIWRLGRGKRVRVDRRRSAHPVDRPRVRLRRARGAGQFARDATTATQLHAAAKTQLRKLAGLKDNSKTWTAAQALDAQKVAELAERAGVAAGDAGRIAALLVPTEGQAATTAGANAIKRASEAAKAADEAADKGKAAKAADEAKAAAEAADKAKAATAADKARAAKAANEAKVAADATRAAETRAGTKTAEAYKALEKAVEAAKSAAEAAAKAANAAAIPPAQPAATEGKAGG
jgi:hypothetical protein